MIERTSDEPVDAAGYDWLIVTSPNGADEIASRGRNLPAVAAVGPGTAEALRVARDRARVRAGRVVAGRPAARVSAAGGPRALRGRRRCAPRSDRRTRRRLRPALSHAAARRRSRPTETSSCSRPARQPRPTPDRRHCARRHDRPGDDTRRARRPGSRWRAEAATHDLDWARRGGARSDEVRIVTVITFLTDFGAPGRLRRHVPRRDRRHRPRRARDRRHARHRAAVGAPGRVRPAEHDARICRSACTSRSSTPVSAATAARSPSRPQTANVRRPGQRSADARGGRARRHRGARARERALSAARGVAHVPRARRLRAGGGAPRRRRRDRGARAAARRRRPRAHRRARSRDRQVADLRDRCSSVDRFGNVATNVRRPHIEALGLANGDRVEVRLALDRYYAVRRRHVRRRGRAS